MPIRKFFGQQAERVGVTATRIHLDRVAGIYTATQHVEQKMKQSGLTIAITSPWSEPDYLDTFKLKSIEKEFKR